MNNFTIDGSVYTFPFHATEINKREIDNVYRDVVKLLLLIQDDYKKQSGNNHYYFSKDDITCFFNRCKKPMYTVSGDFFKKEENYNFIFTRYKAVIEGVTAQFEKMGFRNGGKNIQESNLGAFTRIDSWFNIEDVANINEEEPLLDDDFTKKIYDNERLTNLKKNITVIAALNKYVYKNDGQHSLVLSSNLPDSHINAKNVKCDILMKKGVAYQYRIKNMPMENICIENQKIDVTYLEHTIYETNRIAKKEFQYDKNNNPEGNLVYGQDVDNSIKQYNEKILNMRNNENREKIDKWLNIYPDILYKNLKTLNEYVTYNDFSETLSNSGERYHCCKDKIVNDKNCNENSCLGVSSCKKKCKFLERCGSNIHYFGLDCVDEFRKRDLELQDDRKWKDCHGAESLYLQHLRLKTVGLCDHPLWFLSLRIHFRHIIIDNKHKIEIGWIGRHLFMGCPLKKENRLQDCKRRFECPVHPDCNVHDKGAKDLDNFRKQWPWPSDPGILTKF